MATAIVSIPRAATSLALSSVSCIAAVREVGRYRAWSRTTARTGLPETLEALLHAVHAHRNAIDERERFRVLGQDAREHACDNVTKSLVASILEQKLPLVQNSSRT